MEGKIQKTICSCIKHLLHDELFEDAGKISDEDEEEDNEGSEEDEWNEEEEEEEEELHEVDENNKEQHEEEEAGYAEEQLEDPEMQWQEFRGTAIARVCSGQLHQA